MKGSREKHESKVVVDGNNERKLKIAHIAPPWVAVPPKNYGGTENVIDALIRAQNKKGHMVTLFAPGTSKVPEGVTLVSFFKEPLFDKLNDWDAHLHANIHYRDAVKHIDNHNKRYPNEKFNVVHVHFSATSDLMVFPYLKDHLPNMPVVSTLHSTFPFDHKFKGNDIADLLYKDFFKDVPMVAISYRFKHVANAQVKEFISEGLNFVGVVYNGLSTKEFDATDDRPGEYFMWLGRINRIKGLHLAIHAAKKAGKPLVIAGGAYEDSQKEYFNKIIQPMLDVDLTDGGKTNPNFTQAQVEKLIAEGKQIIFVGSANSEQKKNLYKRAQAFLNPIEWEEPFGMVLIEANSCGCPVISFERGAIPEIIKDGYNGYLIKDTLENPQQAVETMAQRIRKVNNDCAQGDFTMRRNAREHVVQNLSNQAMADRYEEVYKSVIKEKQIEYLKKRLATPNRIDGLRRAVSFNI